MPKYYEQLKDPRWQKKRLKILERDNWTCQNCGNTNETLAVHHRIYLEHKSIWNYPDNLLVTLCESCHQKEIELREQYESELINAFRYYFFYNDIKILTDGAMRFHLHSDHTKIANAYSLAFALKSSQETIVNNFDDFYKMCKPLTHKKYNDEFKLSQIFDSLQVDDG